MNNFSFGMNTEQLRINMENLLWFIGGMLFYISVPVSGILGAMIYDALKRRN